MQFAKHDATIGKFFQKASLRTPLAENAGNLDFFTGSSCTWRSADGQAAQATDLAVEAQTPVP